MYSVSFRRYTTEILLIVASKTIQSMGVPRFSVVKCFTRNPGVLDSSRTGSSGFLCGNVLGQDTSEPQPGKTQEGHK